MSPQIQELIAPQGVVYAALLREHAVEIAALDAARALNRPAVAPAKPAGFQGYPAPARHLQEFLDNGFPVPLCHARAMNGADWSKGGYTLQPAYVTCKRCLKTMAAKREGVPV